MAAYLGVVWLDSACLQGINKALVLCSHLEWLRKERSLPGLLSAGMDSLTGMGSVTGWDLLLEWAPLLGWDPLLG